MSKESSSQWVKVVERTGDFWKNAVMISTLDDTRRLFGVEIPSWLTTRRGMQFTHWVDQSVMPNCSAQIEQKFRRNPRFIEKIRNVFEKSRNTLALFSANLTKTDLRSISDARLLTLYKKFTIAYRNLYPAFHLAVCIEFLNGKENIKKMQQFIELLSKIRLAGRQEFENAHLASQNLFIEIGSRRGLSIEEVKWLHPKEIESLISEGVVPDARSITERKSASVLFFHNRAYTILEGGQATDFVHLPGNPRFLGEVHLDEKELMQKFQAMPWEVWLHRRFSPFVTYLMMTHGTPAGFKTAGLEGQFPFALYDTDDWYGTPEMFALAGEEAGRFLKQKDIFTLTRQCEEILERGRREIPKLCESREPSRILFGKVLDIVKPANVYIWIAHASEAYYKPIIQKAVEPYVAPEDIERYVGDISFPSKKNGLAQMETDIRTGYSVEELHKKYAWINSRGGFQPGYTLEEIAEIREKTLNKPEKSIAHVEIPEAIRALAQEVQELVYLRTLRTDALYELYYLAQPIFERYAEELGVDSLQHYIPDELLTNHFERVPHEYAILKYYEEVVVVRQSIVSQKSTDTIQVKGAVAFKGKVTGKVRIVHTPEESKDVEVGDILVTNMTTPAYILAMHRAAAFITNEGGITCHAAILARELKKPCITGTKIATKILKDGDLVEVDAEKGTVSVLK